MSKGSDVDQVQRVMETENLEGMTPTPGCREPHNLYSDIFCDLPPGHRGDHQMVQSHGMPGTRTTHRWPDPEEAALANLFAFHAPGSHEVRATHEAIRGLIGNTAEQLRQLIPVCGERTAVMNKLQEAMFWANACVALHHPHNQGDSQ